MSAKIVDENAYKGHEHYTNLLQQNQGGYRPRSIQEMKKMMENSQAMTDGFNAEEQVKILLKKDLEKTFGLEHVSIDKRNHMFGMCYLLGKKMAQSNKPETMDLPMGVNPNDPNIRKQLMKKNKDKTVEFIYELYADIAYLLQNNVTISTEGKVSTDNNLNSLDEYDI